jgi:Mn-dependent DtxR family transcriptional regulator
MEIDMLYFINENNITNKLVSYKDISSKFNITKPTTRSKINGLQFKNLVSVEQRGRFKSLKITSSGRRLI